MTVADELTFHPDSDPDVVVLMLPQVLAEQVAGYVAELAGLDAEVSGYGKTVHTGHDKGTGISWTITCKTGPTKSCTFVFY